MGDIISEDGKLNKNIAARVSKSIGIQSQIMNILREVSIGFHFFEIANIFRNLKFINGVLTNAEVWSPIKLGKRKVIMIQ